MSNTVEKRVMEQEKLFRKFDRVVAKIAAENGMQGEILALVQGGHLEIRQLVAAKAAENPPIVSQTPHLGETRC